MSDQPIDNQPDMNCPNQSEQRDAKPDSTEAAKFLERDFNHCFTQMRHYDSQVFNVLKFCFTSYAALVGVAFGLYQFSIKEDSSADLIPVAASILGIGYIFGLFMLSLVVRNRVYFVLVTRYINEHRKFFLDQNPLGFENATRMYTSLTKPQFFNWRSSQGSILYLLALLNSVLLFGFVIAISGWKLALTAFIASVVLQLGLSIGYLVNREMKSADSAVFGSKD